MIAKLSGRVARAGATTTFNPVRGSMRSSGVSFCRAASSGRGSRITGVAAARSFDKRLEEIDRNREDRRRVPLRSDLEQGLKEAQLDRDRVLADLRCRL